MADPLSKLTAEQKEIAAKIRDICDSFGVDPNFGLAIGWAENRFRNRDNAESGAVGPMQVMPSNAKGLGMKTADLNDVDKNIEAGCRILKENLDAFGGDSKLAAIAYNANPNTAKLFAKHNDESRLPDETQTYLKTLNTVYEIGRSASVTDKDPFDKPAAPEENAADTNQPDVFSDQDSSIANENDNKEFKSKIPVKDIIAATTGLGAVAGTAEYGVGPFKKLTGSPSSISAADPNSPGQKWSSKTGYGKGEGYTVQEVARAYEKAKNKGKISGKLAPGETLNIHDWAKQKQLAEELAKKSKLKEIASTTSKYLGKIPLGSTLAGYSGGVDIAEALQRYEKGNLGGALIKGVGGLGSLASMIPHPIPRLVGGALALGSIPAEYAYQIVKENERSGMPEDAFSSQNLPYF